MEYKETKERRDENFLAEKKELASNMDMFEQILNKGYGEYKLYKFVTKDTEKMIVDITISAMDTVKRTSYLEINEKHIFYKQMAKKISDFKLETNSNFDSGVIADKVIKLLGNK